MGAFNLPNYLTAAPKAFAGFAARINALLRVARALENMQGGKGIDVKVSEANIVISAIPIPVLVANSGVTIFPVKVGPVTAVAINLPTVTEVKTWCTALYQAGGDIARAPRTGDFLIGTNAGSSHAKMNYLVMMANAFPNVTDDSSIHLIGYNLVIASGTYAGTYAIVLINFGQFGQPNPL